LDQEVRKIQTALEASRTTDKFEIVPRWAVRVDDLQKALLDAAPQIVHFSGGKNSGTSIGDERRHVQMIGRICRLDMTVPVMVDSCGDRQL
jgi:hypothetical protein